MNADILVVEQYADLRLAIRSALSRGHYVCDCVATEEDAIKLLLQKSYAAILLAPVLPITGDKVIRFLQENRPEQMNRLILMTEPEVATDPYRHIEKPFGGEQLIRVLPRK